MKLHKSALALPNCIIDDEATTLSFHYEGMTRKIGRPGKRGRREEGPCDKRKEDTTMGQKAIRAVMWGRLASTPAHIPLQAKCMFVVSTNPLVTTKINFD